HPPRGRSRPGLGRRRAPGAGASSRASAPKPQQAGEPVHDAARPVVVYDVDLDALGEGLLDGVVDAAVVVLPVGEQRTHLATLERLERRLDSVHRPAGADALTRGLGVRTLPGALALFAQGERRLAHLGRRDALWVQAYVAEQQCVEVAV